MLVADLGLVGVYGSNFPFQDDWTLVPVLTGTQDFTASWLWAQHNEHRLPLAKAALVATHRLSGMNFRTAMYINVALLALVAVALILCTQKARNGPSWTDAFYPVVLLHWGHAENLLWAWQLGFVVATAVLLCWLALVLRGEFRSKGLDAFLVVVCACLLPLCGPIGLCFMPFVTLWPVMCFFRSKSDAILAGAGKMLLAGAILATIVTFLYFIGYDPGPGPPRPSIPDTLRTIVQFISLGWGLDAPWGWLAGGIVLVAGYAMTFLLLAWQWRVDPGRRAVIGGLLCFLVGFLALVGVISWSRAGIGPTAGLAKRYVTLAVLGPCLIYAALRLNTNPLSRYAATVLVLLCAGTLWSNVWAGQDYAIMLRSVFTTFKADMAAGLPPAVLAEKYTHPPLVIGFSYLRRRFPGWLIMMHEAGHPEFRSLKGSLATETIHIKGHRGKEFGPRFDVEGDQFVYAVAVPKAAPELKLICLDPDRSVHSFRLFDGKLLGMSRDKVLLAWVNKPMTRFALIRAGTLQPDDAQDAEVLVLPQDRR
jgi:hypothetical protein